MDFTSRDDFKLYIGLYTIRQCKDPKCLVARKTHNFSVDGIEKVNDWQNFNKSCIIFSAARNIRKIVNLTYAINFILYRSRKSVYIGLGLYERQD
jgi:hypothetical protein